MGYRSQDNRAADDREDWKRLPWRERYDWSLIVAGAVIVVAFAAGLVVQLYVPDRDPIPCGDSHAAFGAPTLPAVVPSNGTLLTALRSDPAPRPRC